MSLTEYGQNISAEVIGNMRSCIANGEVTVLELLNIILSHSTHHLKQVYHLMQTDLGITLKAPATDADFDGIQTPDALF